MAYRYRTHTNRHGYRGPLDIMGKLDGFRESFDLERYYAQRKVAFDALITYSQRPEASSARETVKQILRLADEYDGEAGRLFKACYREGCMNT